ncbi:vesicle-associated membrane protein 721-like [Magnolia sinica]|uniref:vesicle-associated membrane protein 721-like n=1 Tax=Magnolia sinica TaxID=86752 RepID=UPI00265B65FF|nr:vesicle-associated membrane protein 721-like [Magnolia sinica]
MGQIIFLLLAMTGFDHAVVVILLDVAAYCVVAVESVGRKILIAFLEWVKDDFNKKYGGGRATTAIVNNLNKEFGSKLKEHIQYCVDHPEEISKLAKVKAQVSEVKGVMMENIEKVLTLQSIDDIAALQIVGMILSL